MEGTLTNCSQNAFSKGKGKEVRAKLGTNKKGDGHKASPTQNSKLKTDAKAITKTNARMNIRRPTVKTAWSTSMHQNGLVYMKQPRYMFWI